MQLNNILEWNIINSQGLIDKFGKWDWLVSISQLVIQDKNNKIAGKNNYKDVEYVVFDTETKWFNDDIIEIWAIIVKDNKIKAIDWKFYDYSYFIWNKGANINKIDKFSYFIKPRVLEIPKLITELTHIDLDMILKGLETNETFENFWLALTAFIKYVWNRPLIAHNAKFDTRMFKFSIWSNLMHINNEIKEGKITIKEIENFFSLPVIDTLTDAKQVLKLNVTENHKNNSLSTLFGLLPNEDMLHRAFYDVIFTTRIFYWLYETVNNSLSKNTITTKILTEKEIQDILLK